MTITDGKPEGCTTLTPFLVCSPASEAIRFYEAVFGDGRLQLSDPDEQYGLVVPARDDDSVSGSICIYVADVDAVFAKAVERGATVREKPDTFVTGDRFASIYDPFGHRWAVMTKVEDVSSAEAERRLAEWGAQQG
jgi:PhnB protein